MSAQLHDSDELTENHEINVTPFIDVILVLLIIFMVAAPLATVDIPVDLPPIQAQPQEKPKDPVYLTLSEDLTLRLGEQAVEREGLAAALKQAISDGEEQRIFLRADRNVDYGDLIALMNQLRAAGYFKVALVGEEGAG